MMKYILQKNIPLRNHISKYKLVELFNKSNHNNYGTKPKGFWYGLKWYWLENINLDYHYTQIDYDKHNNKVYSYQGYLYEIVLNDDIITSLAVKNKNKLLVLKNWSDLRKFFKLYGKLENKMEHINWNEVSNDYGGIEIRNIYAKKTLRTKNIPWFYGWDVPSGCIWNVLLIKGIKLIE